MTLALLVLEGRKSHASERKWQVKESSSMSKKIFISRDHLPSRKGNEEYGKH
jgi:hypothetical protein